MRPYYYGAIAALTLLLIYGSTMTLLSGLPAAVEQFRALWWLMVPLALGFGVQVGMFTKLKSLQSRNYVPLHDSNATKSLTAGSASSTISMLACCAHHITDVIPYIGLSGVSIFLTGFQKPLLAASIGINLIGIKVMHNHLKKISL